MTKNNIEQTKAIAKKGGPYTEQEKLDRQNKVYYLHFERSYSAVRISEELGVNRNTINSDIKTLYLQLADELPERDGASLFLSYLHASKHQKARLLEMLERPHDPKTCLKIEKMIFDVDYKLGQTVVKLMKKPNFVSPKINVHKSLSPEKEENSVFQEIQLRN